jgi:hypothetical protein
VGEAEPFVSDIPLLLTKGKFAVYPGSRIPNGCLRLRSLECNSRRNTLTLLTAGLPPSRYPSRRCCSSQSSSQRFAPPPHSVVVATVPSPSSEQSSLATFRAKTRNIRRSLAPPFRKKSRLYFLFVCKRTHDENTALPTFCGSRLRRDCALACGSGSLYSLLTFYPPTL